IRGIEQLAAGNHDDVNAARSRTVRAPEDLSNQALSTVPPDGVSKLAGGDDPESRLPCRIGRRENGQEAALCPAGPVEHVLKLAAATQPPGGREAFGLHRGPERPLRTRKPSAACAPSLVGASAPAGRSSWPF